MVQYLVILLDDTSVSFCHYHNDRVERKLMPIDILKEGILYGMKENLNIQFVYPNYDIPQDYKEAIETIDHTKIKPATMTENANVVVIDSFENVNIEKDKTYVLRLAKYELFDNIDKVSNMIEHTNRLNIVLTDIDTFSEEDFERYKTCLTIISEKIEQEYVAGKTPQINILTDSMMLNKMNNCGAGETNITLAPDGKFYVCPAFYLSNDGYAIGDLTNGLDIKNPQLYKLDYAPLCRHCDAYQCRRCIWLNRKTTLEVNTPSHEQCVVTHLERNASRTLLMNIRKHGDFLPDKEIKEINYLDPFDVRKEW